MGGIVQVSSTLTYGCRFHENAILISETGYNVAVVKSVITFIGTLHLTPSLCSLHDRIVRSHREDLHDESVSVVAAFS